MQSDQCALSYLPCLGEKIFVSAITYGRQSRPAQLGLLDFNELEAPRLRPPVQHSDVVFLSEELSLQGHNSPNSYCGPDSITLDIGVHGIRHRTSLTNLEPFGIFFQPGAIAPIDPRNTGEAIKPHFDN